VFVLWADGKGGFEMDLGTVTEKPRSWEEFVRENKPWF
jgi:hypothetical protein